MPPAARALSACFSNSPARSVSAWRNLAVSPWNFAIMSMLMVTDPLDDSCPRGNPRGLREGYVTAAGPGSPGGLIWPIEPIEPIQPIWPIWLVERERRCRGEYPSGPSGVAGDVQVQFLGGSPVGDQPAES